MVLVFPMVASLVFFVPFFLLSFVSPFFRSFLCYFLRYFLVSFSLYLPIFTLFCLLRFFKTLFFSILPGRKVVEEPLDQKTARSLSQYIKEDYIKLAQAVDQHLSIKCEHVKKMKGNSSDRCFFFLQTWITHKKPTLRLLMQKLREVGCEKGMNALLKHFENQLEKSLDQKASGPERYCRSSREW